MKKKILVALITFGTIFAQAQNTAKKYEIDFLKGDLSQKIENIKVADSSGDFDFSLKGLEFALDASKIIGKDEELENLVNACVQSISKGNLRENQKAGTLLAETFRSFDNEEIRMNIFDSFSINPDKQSVSLANAYFSEKMNENSSMTPLLIKTAAFLGSNGNTASFTILFISDILEIWPDYTDNLQNAYGNLANSCENEILRIFTTVPDDKKLKIIKKIKKIEKISPKIKGEIAENALSSIIYTVEESSENYQDTIELQLECAELIAATKWTRAQENLPKLFEAIREEHEAKLVSSEDFSKFIMNLKETADNRCTQSLISYLDFLNKNSEIQGDVEGSIYTEQLVLSIINVLGELGNKAAFDTLLEATYAKYSENVKNEAKNALTKLKWQTY